MNKRRTSILAGIILIFIVGLFLFWRFQLNVQGMQPDIKGDLKDFNFIFITIDALRADHLGCYGYRRNTSPFIDSLAREGMVFERAMSNSSFTRESVSVIFSGLLPSSGNSVNWEAKPSDKSPTMGECFHQAGYETGFFSNHLFLNDPAFTRGFKDIWFCDKRGVSGNGPKLVEKAGEFAKKCGKAKKKFMMYLHFMDPHAPYKPPEAYYRKFAPSVYPKPLHLYNYVRKNCDTLIKEGFGPGEERFEDLVLRYDAEIALVDHSLRVFFNTLKNLRLVENTFVIITADHGEEFLEHDYVEHGWTLYEESVHVPLILSAPGSVGAGRVASRVSSVDLLPSILQLMKISHQREHFDGEPLFTLSSGGFLFSPPARPYIAELMLGNRNLTRAVVRGNWKYISAMKWLDPPERPGVLKNKKNRRTSRRANQPRAKMWGPVIREELYNLSRDPAEKRSLPDPSKRKELRLILERYKAHCLNKKARSRPEKHKARELSKRDREKLKTLGYL